MKVCPGCGDPFQPKRSGQESCSRTCANTVVSRRTATQRGDVLRGRVETGSGRYPKLMGQPAHRAVAEQQLGRKLRPDEIVHHLNGDKTDFRPSNIIVISSQKQHARISKLGLLKKAPAPKRRSA
jgi:hypothetical protein